MVNESLDRIKRTYLAEKLSIGEMDGFDDAWFKGFEWVIKEIEKDPDGCQENYLYGKMEALRLYFAT